MKLFKKVDLILLACLTFSYLVFFPSEAYSIKSNDISKYQYLIINKIENPDSTCCYWNPKQPNSVDSCDGAKSDKRRPVCTVLNYKTNKVEPLYDTAAEELRSLIPAETNRSIKLGVQMNIPYFDISPTQASELINNLTALSKEKNLPMVFKLDGFSSWDARPDLWKWWDTNITTEEIDRRKNNVEWTDWTSEAATKNSWVQWGPETKGKPHPNLGSAEYRQEKRKALKRLLPQIINWYNSLPSEKKYLFGGIILDNELSIGIRYYYPNGNDYVDSSTSPDCPTKHLIYPGGPACPLDTSGKSLSLGMQQIGYGAVSSYGIKNSGEITKIDLDEAVNRHSKELADIAASEGIPEDKIFVHGGGNFAGKLFDYSSVVSNIISPGWTFYGAETDQLVSYPSFKKALQLNQTGVWAAAEWSPARPHDFQAWNSSFKNTFGMPGNKLIVVYDNIYNLFDGTKNDQAAKDSILNIIKSAPVADSETITPQGSFEFTQTGSECKTDAHAKKQPVVHLAWDKYRGALSYRILRTETDTSSNNSLVGGFTEQSRPNDEMEYDDLNVLPGKTYIYKVEPILPNSEIQPLVTTIVVGGCNNAEGSITCLPYQTEIKDQTGKASCADKPCQERTTSTCNQDGRCLLVVKDGLQNCQVKISGGDSSTYIVSFGAYIESTIALMCQNSLSDKGINLDSHTIVCKQKALDANSGCLQSIDLNDLRGCVSRIADQAITQLTPGYTVPAAGLPGTAGGDQNAQPAAQGAITPVVEEEIDRTVTEVWLQTADGEDRLKMQGGIIRFPVNKIDPEINEIRVKIVFDKPDKDGKKELARFFKVKRVSAQQLAISCNPDGEIDLSSWIAQGLDCSSDDPASRGEKWMCQGKVKYAYGEKCPSIDTGSVDKQLAQDQTIVPAGPVYNESCWEVERNECTGCGISRTVERYTCDGPWFNQTRTKVGTEGQKEANCVNYEPASLSLVRNECTGCNKARRVEQCPNGLTTITKEDVYDEGCADRCQPEEGSSCEIEDLAYYCEGDNIAVYKYKDNACQIQFSGVSCKDRGQICCKGDCISGECTDE